MVINTYNKMKDLTWHHGKSNSTVMEHNAFLKRIKKTLYYGSIPKYQSISRPMAEYAAGIFSETHKGYSLNRLKVVTAGNVNVTPCSLILAIIYLDRLNDTDPNYAKRITPTELFLVSMMVSTKFYCGYDEDVYLSEWAEYGNISVDALRKIELDFLNALNWEAYVSNKEFFDKLKSIEFILAKRESCVRGWLTYTEMVTLFPSFEILKEFFYYNIVLLISYTIGFITIASAFILASHVPGNSLYTKISSTSKLNTTNNTSSNNSVNITNDNGYIDSSNIMLTNENSIILDEITNVKEIVYNFDITTGDSGINLDYCSTKIDRNIGNNLKGYYNSNKSNNYIKDFMKFSKIILSERMDYNKNRINYNRRGSHLINLWFQRHFI